MEKTKKQNKFGGIETAYFLGGLLVLDFILFNLLGWFDNLWISVAYLVILTLIILLKPRWGMIFLVFTTVLDNVSLLGARPYQWLVFLIVTTWIVLFHINYFSKKQGAGDNIIVALFKDFKNYWKHNRAFALVLALLFLSSLIGIINAPNQAFSLKQAVVLAFALVIAFLVNRRAQENSQQFQVMSWAFILASIPVGLFALYQNIAHEYGFDSFEVMPARPNSTFYEPDWLGIYVAFVLVLLVYQLMLRGNVFKAAENRAKTLAQCFGIWMLFLLNTIVLIISVARASWVAITGAFLGFFGLAFVALIFKKIPAKTFFRVLQVTLGWVLATGLALILIHFLNLTRFNLKDRVLSIVNQEHIVTMAEKDGVKIKIDLEEINFYQEQGWLISEEKIEDENVTARFSAYANNWELAQKHWLLGQGQGSILAERDFVHNANNIFYEWLIAGGILGFSAFVALMLMCLKEVIYLLFLKDSSKGQLFNEAVLALMGVTVIFFTNLFNSGVLFVPMWVMIGLLWQSGKIK